MITAKTSKLTQEEIDASISAGNSLMTAVEIGNLMRRRQQTVRVWFKSGTMRSIHMSNTTWYTTYEEVLRYIAEGPWKGEVVQQ